MKQEIVIKVQMSCEKCRTKAMKIAVTADGVSSVAKQGSENDQLVVSGEGVDPANLTRSLRKKLCYATILSVEEVKEKVEEKPEKNRKFIVLATCHSFQCIINYINQIPTTMKPSTISIQQITAPSCDRTLISLSFNQSPAPATFV